MRLYKKPKLAPLPEFILVGITDKDLLTLINNNDLKKPIKTASDQIVYVTIYRKLDINDL